MASPQQQQQAGNTPGPSPGASQTQQPNGGGGNPSPMNGGRNAAMAMIRSVCRLWTRWCLLWLTTEWPDWRWPVWMLPVSNNRWVILSCLLEGCLRFDWQTYFLSFDSRQYLPKTYLANVDVQVQVIQQQIPYLQQLHSNAQGTRFIMPGNISLQPKGVNQTMQVILILYNILKN